MTTDTRDLHKHNSEKKNHKLTKLRKRRNIENEKGKQTLFFSLEGFLKIDNGDGRILLINLLTSPLRRKYTQEQEWESRREIAMEDEKEMRFK